MRTSVPRPVRALLLAAVMLGGFAPFASAAVLTLDAIERAWIEQSGGTNGGSPDGNYITGNCGAGDCDEGEFRSWFQFAIPVLTGPVASARLIFATADMKVEQGPSMTLSVTDLPSVFGFSDLGTGTAYGSRDYTIGDEFTTQTIELSAAALADIAAAAGSTFGVSGRISAGAAFDPAGPNQFLFGSTNGGDLTQLEITLAAARAVRVPAPATLALLGVGLALLGLRRKA